MLARLAARGPLGIRLGLGRTRAILGALGDPHAALRGVLVGGTNGKGSTQAMVASVLRHAGYRVGQTPKPHLVSYRERVLVDGTPIPARDLDAILDETIRAADSLAARHGPATEFELLTAAAFLWLARSAVDVAVVEVGLGGRLDATNAWDGGVAAITNVALDHQELLGPDITSIAREKAAIIKPGNRAVTGALGVALGPIRRRAASLRVPLRVVRPMHVEKVDLQATYLRDEQLGDLRIGLLGRHQAHNAAVAVGILRALDETGIARLDEGSLREGLAAARWPGRLEMLARDGVTVLLDGAHNPDGAIALAEAIGDLGPQLPTGRATLLFAVMRDKDVPAMMLGLAASRVLREARALMTEVPGSERTADAAWLAREWAATPGVTIRPHAVPDAFDALGQALEEARSEGGPLIVAGSLYLVGLVRKAILAERGAPDP